MDISVLMTSNSGEYVIHVRTLQSDQIHWIKIRRNNLYRPMCHLPPKRHPSVGEWQIVQSKKESQPLIYYWTVIDHNLFQPTDTSEYHLFFAEPDLTQIENNDHDNYMALDDQQHLQLIHVHLKHKGMKMTPNYFIAKSPHQIQEALKVVKYCVIQVIDNVQTIIPI